MSNQSLRRSAAAAVIAVAALLVASGKAFAWQASVDGTADPAWEYANSVTVDGSGNVIAAGIIDNSGTDFDFAVVKFDPLGTELWRRAIDGTANDRDWASAVTVDSTDNVIAVGYLINLGDVASFVVVKFDPNGTELWRAEIDGLALSVTVDSEDNVIASGYLANSTAGVGFAVVKFDPDGNELWRAAPAEGWAYSVTVDGEDNVIASGNLANSTTDADFAVVKFDPLGAELWRAEISGTASSSWDTAVSVTVDGSGNVIAGGNFQNSGTDFDFAVVKFDPAGTELWRAEINGASNGPDSAISVDVDVAGNVTAAGNLKEISQDFAVVKFDADGAELWRTVIDGTANTLDVVLSVTVDRLGNAIAAGSLYNLSTDLDFTVVKFDADGTELWRLEIDGTANRFDVARSVAVDHLGNVVAAGGLTTTTTFSDLAVVKRHGPDGSDFLSTTETVVGTDVVVQPDAVDENGDPTGTAPVTITFDEVTVAGETTVTVTPTGTPPPDAFRLGNPPIYFVIETTAVYEGSIEICIDYGDISYGSESQLRLFHFVEGSGWGDVTTSLDTVNDIICAVVTSLSLFGIFEPADPAALLAALADRVVELNLHNGISNSLDAKLDSVQRAISDVNTNNDVAAVNALHAFINEVTAQSGNKIPVADADDLIAAARVIIGLLASP